MYVKCHLCKFVARLRRHALVTLFDRSLHAIAALIKVPMRDRNGNARRVINRAWYECSAQAQRIREGAPDAADPPRGRPIKGGPIPRPRFPLWNFFKKTRRTNQKLAGRTRFCVWLL